MVGQWTKSRKPSRSDVVSEPDQQVKTSERVRAHFDSLTPKRPSKPSRSDPDSSSSSSRAEPGFSQSHPPIPELQKLHSLIAARQSQVVFAAELGDQEFVETHYYRELGSIDKQHHTTGSGFIKLVREEESKEANLYDYHFGGPSGTLPMRFRSNPAMNDWVPKMEEDQLWV